MDTTFRDILTDAIRYWERRRILYNLILSAVVAAFFLLQLPGSRSALSFELVQRLFILAVLANVAYCAAYPVDFVAQFSGFQATWRRNRWVLFAVGALFAGTIARFIAGEMFVRAE